MRQRSLLWPFILIAAGITWMLVELGTIPGGNLWALTYIWPFILMAIGVGLVLRSRWPVVREFVSGLIVLGMLLSIIFAPQLGWNQAPAWGTINLVNWSNFNGPIRGSGVSVSQTREAADFNSIEINYPAEITIRQGDLTSLTVQAEDNLQPQLATRVSGNSLYIENSQPDWNRRVSPTLPVKILITVRDLQRVDFPSAGMLQVENFQSDNLEIALMGAGTIHLDGLTTKNLSLDLSGAGTITASGAVDNLSVTIEGLGGFQGGDLASQAARINISGAGSATAWVKNNMSVNISGVGSVSYYGSPSIDRNITGLGGANSLGNK
jgi:hypothetical protein